MRYFLPTGIASVFHSFVGVLKKLRAVYRFIENGLARTMARDKPWRGA